MWWSETGARPTRRRVLLLTALAPAALAGCGFTPLYGEGTPASRMAGRVEVPPLEGEAGFTLHERLTGRLGVPAQPAYRLDVTLSLTRSGVALTQQNVTTRFDVIGVAEYTLVPLSGGPAVASGVVRAVTGFSAPESETASAFASRAAQKDAERRLAVDLADRIVQRLALAPGLWT